MISELLEHELPDRYLDCPVQFPATWDASVSHRVEVATVAGFAVSRLGVDPAGGLSVPDWLILTGQSILEVTAGPLFTDRTAALAQIRATLRWYPPEVERYVLAAGWQRLAEQLPMVGRSAEHGDELGSRLISAALAQDLMALAFALSRQWLPYAKWRGTVFQALPLAESLAGLLNAAVAETGWRDRENALATAANVLLEAQRQRGLPAPAVATTPFWDRPYRTISDSVPDALLGGITDPFIRRLPRAVGSIEQWADSVDLLASPARRAALQSAYLAWIALS
jgi:hypothetical protein